MPRIFLIISFICLIKCNFIIAQNKNSFLSLNEIQNSSDNLFLCQLSFEDNILCSDNNLTSINNSFQVADIEQYDSPAVIKSKSGGTFTDNRDGKTYRFIKIGKQTWMAENLNYVSTGNCWCYNDSNVYCNIYGRLYDWNTAKESCTAGWHLPSDDEWNILINLLGGVNKAGGKMKSKTDWNNPNKGATDSVGFAALGGGFRLPNEVYSYLHIYGTWWTSTESDSQSAWNKGLTAHKTSVYRSLYGKNYGRSVRCIKDSN